MKNLFLAASLLSLSSVPALAQSQKKTELPKTPKLTVVIVVDQFRQDYLNRYSAFFGEKGFKWLQGSGANLVNARYGYATTYTGPGHAVISSGSYGNVNGIIGNKFYNMSSKRSETMFFDPNSSLVGTDAKASYKEDDTSPKNFIGSTIGDQLRLNNPASKVVSVALKDRAAVMLAGRLGKAYWYHSSTGGFVSSSFYTKNLPFWVERFNARKIPASFYGSEWVKFLPGIFLPDFPSR